MTAHARLGASSAYRWMNCPGSVALSEQVPAEETSIHAAEGTAAHALAEKTLLDNNAWPTDFIGEELEGFVVTREMAEAVADYVREVRERIQKYDILLVEQRVSLDALGSPEPMFGTADAVIYSPTQKLLTIIDYKHGMGVGVDVENNPQLRFYGLATMVSHPEWEVNHVAMVVVQPRFAHADGPIRFDVIEAPDLMIWAADLLAAAEATKAADAPTNPGSWCRFCPAKAVCPSLMDTALAAAKVEFKGEPQSPEHPSYMTDEQLGAVLDQADLIEAWVKAVKDLVFKRLHSGHPVPGYKLVEKRATRKWRSEAEVTNSLKAQGFGDEIFETKLKSPAQLEKIVGKGDLEAFIERVSSGLTLAPEADKRPAASGGSEFFDK